MTFGRTNGNKSKMNDQTHQVCIKCKKKKSLKSDYYSTISDLYPNGNYPVCKLCITEKIPLEIDPLDNEFLSIIKSVLLELNKPFIFNTWLASIEEAKRRNWKTFNAYMKNISLPQNKDLTWNDSDYRDNNKENELKRNTFEGNCEHDESIRVNDNKNKEDVLRMLGYDPFEYENESDKRHLYNKLVDFLDEGTLEDSFKLPAVIEIVKSFNQLDKINSALAHATSDSKQLSTNAGNIKSLVDTKEKMLKTVLALAKDNGISVNHNNNKSKGAGTLSGIIKQLHEKGIDSAEINVYDIETCAGMKQVADISNKSIFEQLTLNENDYTEMIKEQRELLIKLQQRVEELEEENRKLHITLKTMT